MTWPTAKDVNSNGKVRCFDLVSKKYVYKHSIDIRECLQKGVVARFSPEDNIPEASNAPDPVELIASVEKATKAELKAIVEANELKVDIDKFEKLSDKREAVIAALKPAS